MIGNAFGPMNDGERVKALRIYSKSHGVFNEPKPSSTRQIPCPKIFKFWIKGVPSEVSEDAEMNLH